MSQVYLSLALGRTGVGGKIGFTEFIVGFDENSSSLLELFEIRVYGGIERENVVPGDLCFWPR
jgi:hypothetical protein